MSKKSTLFIGSILLFTLSVLADTNINDISPFSPEADSYVASIRNNFENLPTITEPTKHNIESTEKIVEAQTQKKLTGTIKPSFISFDDYKNCKIMGTINIKTLGPIIINNKKTYLWLITGKVQYYFVKSFTNKTELRNEKFFFVLHFDNNNWKEDCLIIGETIFKNDATLQNAVALVSEPLRKNNIETLYKNSIEKDKWDFNKREIQGKLTGYKNGKASIQDGNKRPFQMDVTKFSLEDQKLIRAYIDHLNIPVRELQNKKQSR
jgi:hypothetical protein